MRVFGHDFTHLQDEALLRDLASLEREAAIYADRWIEAINDFRHVRIDFSPEEVREFVRSVTAWDSFIASGRPRSAGLVLGIPFDIAARADAYSVSTGRGTIGPPYHCLAAFLGPVLEELFCFAPRERWTILEAHGRDAVMLAVTRAIDSLVPAIRKFNRREKGLAPWPVTREDDVRDLLFAMLRATLSDIIVEEAVPSRAGSHKFVDIFSRAARLFVEVKWVGTPGRWKRVVDELSVDIQSYSRHAECHTLVFVIIDAVKDVGDPALAEKQLSGLQTIDGRELDIRTFIREP